MLPQTGKISMKDVNVELKKSENSRTSLNDNDVRNLSNINDGRISLNDLKGKKYKKKHKVHISLINMIDGHDYYTIETISANPVFKYITKNTTLDLELFDGDIIKGDYNDLGISPIERVCRCVIDQTNYYDHDFYLEVFQDHEIICSFEDIM